MNRHPDTHWALIRLLAASALPVFLLMARVFYTGRITYIFLIWNLFLAWLPLLFAYLSVRLGFKRRLAGLWALAWLLFFPNAPYIITDIMHLPNVGGVPILYDVVMLFAFAMVGIVLGFVSLRWMQWGVAQRWGVWASRFFALTVLGLAGFGIYLGRYLRWNSWDVFTNPIALLRDIAPVFIAPTVYWRVWAMSMLFALLLTFLYWLFATLPRMGMGVSLEEV